MNHDILLNKFKYYGFCEPSLKLIESYLINRAQYVEMGHVKSKNVYLNCGVPQGSILDPLLFIVYLNDMSEASKLFNMLMYADDTTLMGSLEEFGITNKMNESGNLINLELLKIEMWLKLNMLSLNVQKSKFMIFFKHPKTVKPPVVKINHTEVECVDNFVFLGLVLNKHLSWKDHINRTANKVIGIMYKLKHVFPQEALLAIYRSLILPHLNYCILIWGNITKRLFKLQKRALRVIYKCNFLSHTDPIFKDLGLLKVNDIYKVQQLKFYFKLSNRCLPIFFDTFTPVLNFNIHDHNTRHNRDVHGYRVKHEFAKKN